jgi:hypothetical protein
MSSTQEAIQKILSGGFASDGWAGLEGTDPKIKEQRERAQEESLERVMVIARAFMGPNGQAALQALRESTIEQPSFDVQNLGLINGIGYGIMREGQNSIVRYIEACIKSAQQGPSGPEVKSNVRKKRKPISD